MKVDKTLLSIILIFLTVLCEYPLLFPDQFHAAPSVPAWSQIPRNTTEPPEPVPTPSLPPIRNFTSAFSEGEQKCSLRPLTKTLKDSRVWFAISVPENWYATSDWETGYGTWSGLYFYTRLGVEEEIHDRTGIVLRTNTTRVVIMTYTITRNQDQDYRNYYRQFWVPEPVETVEIINGITFNRFESKGIRTAVSYVTRKTSANERGYASLIRYYVSPGECQDEIEQIIHTFRYLTAREISLGTAPGIEISTGYP
jgi:hypothetical protein